MDWTVYAFMFPVCIVIAMIAMASGISGAALLSPTLIIGFPLLGIPTLTAAAAIGTRLFVEFSGFASGVVGYLRRQLVDMRTVRALVVVSVPVAAAAGFLAGAIDPRLLKAIYGVLMLPLAVGLWRQSSEELRPGSSDPKPRHSEAKDEDEDEELSRVEDADGNSTSGERATAAPDVR
jgi:uncharacterized membrane protein YfcA